MANLTTMMNQIQTASIDLVTRKFNNAEQKDGYECPAKFRDGRIYSPLAFDDERDQIEQAEQIIAYLARK
jgi:hypothetical protein